MSQPPDAPLTEEDAEAVVRALGPQLEWAQIRNTSGKPWLPEVAPVAAGRYFVSIYKVLYEAMGMNQYITRWQPSEDSNRKVETSVFESKSAAKAACERHFATGKWEG